MTIQQSPTNSSVSVDDLPMYDLENMMNDESGKPISKGGVACPFPWRLHECLDAVEREGLEHIVSWQSHGRSFTVFQPKKFAELVMPRFFGQTRYASFQRQLNIYGFGRYTQGRDKGAYFHLCMVKGHRQLVRDMRRKKIKGVKSGAPILAPVEYDFYQPCWVGHFDASLPAGLTSSLEAPLAVEERVVSPVVSKKVVASIQSNHLDLAALTFSKPSVLSSETFDWSLFSLLEDEIRPSGVVSNKNVPASAVSDDEHSSGYSIGCQDSDDDVSLFGGALEDIFEESSFALDPAPVSNYNMAVVDPFFQLFA